MAGNRRRRARSRRRQITLKMKRKLALLFVAIVLILAGIFGWLVYIIRVSGEQYTRRVLAQQDTNSILLPYKRGDIYDRNGTILATSEKVYNLILDPAVLLENQSTQPEKDCVEPTLQALVSYFGLDREELNLIMTEKKTSHYVVLRKQLTKDEVSELEEAMKEDDSRIAGVWLEDSYIRRYPYDSLACNVIGYTVAGNVGQYGIEQQYSDTLNGENGRSYNYLNEDLEQAKVVRKPTDGNTVVSTIDVTLQSIAEKYIQKFVEDYTNKNVEGPAALNIAVLMMNPQNGEILAMARDVTFDLNNPHDLVANGYLTQEELDAMSEEEQLDAKNQMWRNFCISDGFEPGSTVKPMTVAGALEMGIINDSTTFLCDGGQVIVEGQQPIRCAKRSGHGLITLDGSIMFSCNDALMQIGAMEGYDNYLKYQQMFNFGLKTNIDLPGETNNATTVFSKDNMGPTELATSTFGQGFNTTMIQVASAFSSVINGGYYYRPHVVKRILDSSGGTVETINPVLVRQTISSKTSALLKQYLYHTMYGEADQNGNNPTGKKGRIAGYAMGGKTGTAQKLPRSREAYVVSFIGFAPVDNPQVVCYVVVDEPNAADPVSQASSSYALEIYKNIMKEALPYLNIYATEEIPADMQEEVAAENAAKQEAESGDDDEEEDQEGEEGNEDEPEDGTLIDPNTGEKVKMPTPEEAEEQEGGIMNGIGSPILPSGEIQVPGGEETPNDPDGTGDGDDSR